MTATVMHIYNNGERINDTELPGYIHVNRDGKTLGPNLDIELMLEHGYTIGLQFIPLANGDTAVVSTNREATDAVLADDPEFVEAHGKMVQGLIDKHRADAIAEMEASGNPLAGLLKMLMDARSQAQEERRAPQRSSNGMPDFGEFMRMMASRSNDDGECQCEDCRRERGEL